MIIISIDIVKQTYIPTSFPSSSFFLFYNGKHSQTLDYISLHIGQTSVIFFFLQNAPNVPQSLLSAQFVHPSVLLKFKKKKIDYLCILQFHNYST